MKRRNFFKSLAAAALIPILPKPKEEYKFISKVVSKTSLIGDGYLVGTWTSDGPITYPNSQLYGELANKEVKHYKIPRHGVHSIELINRYI